MNKQFFLFGIAAAVMFSSCRKSDLQPNEMTPEVAVQEDKSWKTLSSWNADATGYSSKVEDSHLTPDVVNKGLVLVYIKKDNKTISLPYTDEANNVNWHYQVSDNLLQINGEASANASISKEQISYFILSPEKIQSLEKQGHSKIDIMSFPYEKATSILK